MKTKYFFIFTGVIFFLLLIILLIQCDLPILEAGFLNGGNTTTTLENVVYVSITTGDDANPGTQEEPLKTIQEGIEKVQSLYSNGNVLVSAGVYSVMYPTSYIIIKEGINIRGGYNPANWNDRNIDDPKNSTLKYKTVIDDTAVAGGALYYPTRAVDLTTDITSATLIEGFTILGGDAAAMYTCAIYNFGGAATIQNNYINGGGGTNTHGIYNYNGGSLTIRNNEIIGGDMVDQTSHGIYFTDCNSGDIYTITDNTVDGGCGGGTFSYAVYAANSSKISIFNNNIIGGTGQDAHGIYITGGSDTWSTGNTIHVYNTTASNCFFYGIQYLTSTNNCAINNVINVNAINSTICNGIFIDGTNNKILNNTIGVGSVNSTVYGIRLSTAATDCVITNNIVFNMAGTGGYCICEEFPTSNPLLVNNNNLFDHITSLYYDNGTTSIVDLVTAITLQPGGGTLENLGNVSIDLIDNVAFYYFVDWDGPDDDVTTTFDNDWHLAVDPVILNVREGGLNLNPEPIFPHNINGDKIDRDGIVRTANVTSANNVGAAGWSMGAYEQD